MTRRPIVLAAVSAALLLTISACTAAPGPAGTAERADPVFPDEAVAEFITNAAPCR